jgi:hypothetical protein
MRLGAALLGDLREEMRDEVRNLAPPLRRALRSAGDELKDDLKAHTEAAGLGKLGRAWRHKHFSGRGNPFDMVSIIFPNGRGVRRAIEALDQGVTVRPTKSKYLAIPTNFNRKAGRRGGRVLFKPDQLKDSFVARAKNGNLILFARVASAQSKSRRGQIQQKAFVNSTLSGRNASRLLGSGRRRRTEDVLKFGVVPMFVLVPEVRIKKRLNIDDVVRLALNDLPRRIVAEMDIQDARQTRGGSGRA